MTKQAETVFGDTNWSPSFYREVETALLSHSPKQILALVRKKDPRREHDFDWFRPFFKGYLPITAAIPVRPDDRFWLVYDRIVSHIEPWEVWDDAILLQMQNLDRLEIALRSMKHDTLRELYRAYRQVPVFQRPPEISRKDVQTRDLD